MNDLTGRKFNRLTVIGYVGKPGKAHIWECRCECGKQSRVRAGRLTRGETKSCGCLVVEFNRRTKTIHGECANGSHSHEYTVWVMMKQRCFNPQAIGYERYGGKGIGVSDEWQNFTRFLADMGRAPSPDHSLDRIDQNGNYCRDNCRWATAKVQNRNTKANRMIEFRNETRCLSEWCEIVGLPFHAVYKRLSKYGWSVERSLTEAVSHGRKGQGRPRKRSLIS